MTNAEHIKKYLANQDRAKALKDLLQDLLRDTLQLQSKKTRTNKTMVRVLRAMHKRYLKIVKQLQDSGINLDEGEYIIYASGFYPDAWEIYSRKYCFD